MRGFIQSRARDFSLLQDVYSGFGAHSASFSMDTRYGGWETKLATPSLADLKTEWSCTSAPPMCLHGLDRDTSNRRMPPWLLSMTMTHCSIPCTRQLGCLLWRRIKVSLCKTGGIKVRNRKPAFPIRYMTLKSWIVVSKCNYMWNCFLLTCNSPLNSYPHVSSGCSSESQVLLVLLGKCYKPLGRTKYGFPYKIICFLNYDGTDFLE